MKTQLQLAALALLLSTLNSQLSTCFAATTINATNKFAYGANLGWMDWRGDTNNGAVIGEYVCSGYIYSANAGWISLGSGTPANGIQYQNNSATNYGVNHDGLGNLTGYAYGANIGWINFETNGAAKVDLNTGKLSGYIYSANCGWISLSNAFAFVQTDTIQMGIDTDGDSMSDAWERQKFGSLTIANAMSDNDGDGFKDISEYLADTNPTDTNSLLRITSYTIAPNGSPLSLTWSSRPTRQYHVQKRLRVDSGSWFDVGPGLISPDAGATTTRGFTDSASSQRFFRVEAVKPLLP